MISNHLVLSLFGQATIIAIGIILVAFVAVLILCRNRNHFWQHIERRLYIPFAIVWVMGFATYCVGMFITESDAGEWCRLLRVAPMAVVHASCMFLLENDISAVHDGFHNNLFFMTCFSLVHLLAAMVSMAIVIKHFGYNLIASLQLWFSSCGWFNRFGWFFKDKLYIFWGMNEASFLLARDIQRNASGSYRILFVKTAADSDNIESRAGLDRLFNFLSMNNRDLDHLKDLGCLTANDFVRLSKCKLSDTERLSSTSVLIGKLGLKSIVRLVAKTRCEVHIFFLSEDESTNIMSTTILSRDKDLRAFATSVRPQSKGQLQGGRKVNIYCHARYNNLNRVVEDTNSDQHIEVRIVDSSHFGVSELRSTAAYHPINYVDIDTTDNVGTVKSPFRCMVVGFGEIGQDAARFLYEFGSFVSSQTSRQDDVPGQCNAGREVVKSGFHCCIVDNQMLQRKGSFLAETPAFDDGGLFEYHDCDIHSQQFYDLLDRQATDLNYVVVGLGDDELNIEVAVRIFTYLRRRRSHLHHFRIFVRCIRSESAQRLRTIANHYNEVYAADGATRVEYITLFGKQQSVYTYNQIVENTYELEGRIYNHQYCQSSGNNGQKDVWESRHDYFLTLGTLDGYSELRRKETQDVSAAYHALTKLHIMRRVVEDNPAQTLALRDCLDGGLSNVPAFRREVPRGQRVSGTIRACLDGQQTAFTPLEQLLFLNIARLEHLRWNASHLALGYQHHSSVPTIQGMLTDSQCHRCLEHYHMHNCLIAWEELDQESDLAGWDNPAMPDGREYPDYKLYDFIVVSTTLTLHCSKL